MPARSKVPSTLLLSLLPSLLAGCNVGPDYRVPDAEAPEGWSSQAEGTVPGAADVARWWTAFNDPTLDGLVRESLQGNLDLRIAQARIAEARAQRGIIASQDQPQLDASAGYRNQRASEQFGDNFGPPATTDQNVFRTGFDATWEIDLWGRVRRGVEAADADIDSAVESRRAVMVTLAAEVARNYVELRSLQRRLEIARGNIRLQADSLSLAESRFKGRMASELDVAQQRAQLASSQSVVPVFEAQIAQSIYRLGVLLGKPPATLLARLSPEAAEPVVPPSVPLGLPADAIRRRPDVRQAERQAAAATARIGVATADLYPRLTLLGSLGLSADDLGKMFDANARVWTVGPSITWNLFSGGRVQSNIKLTEAREQAALAELQNRVLLALEDVESSLIAYGKEQVRRRSLAEAVESSRRAVQLAQSQYAAGQVGFLTVIDTQRQQFAAEDALASSNRNVSQSLIALYKALGGGWEWEVSQQTATPPASTGDSANPAG